MWVQFLGWEDPMEEGMVTHSSILAWKNSMDRGAWKATVHGVTKSRTWLKWFSTAQQHLLLFIVVVQLLSCIWLCDLMDCSMPGFSVLHYLPEFDQTHFHWIGYAIYPSNYLLPPLLLPSVFPSVRVFSSELTPHVRWSKYWSISISPSNKYFRVYFL